MMLLLVFAYSNGSRIERLQRAEALVTSYNSKTLEFKSREFLHLATCSVSTKQNQARLSALHCFLLKNSSTSISINLSDLSLLCCFCCDCLGPARRLSLFLSLAANDAEPLAVSFQHTAKRISCNSTLRPCVVFENVSCRPHSNIKAKQQAW